MFRTKRAVRELLILFLGHVVRDSAVRRPAGPEPVVGAKAAETHDGAEFLRRTHL